MRVACVTNELPFPTDPVKTPCQRTKQETKPPIKSKNYKWAQVLLSQLPTKQTVKIDANIKKDRRYSPTLSCTGWTSSSSRNNLTHVCGLKLDWSFRSKTMSLIYKAIKINVHHFIYISAQQPLGSHRPRQLPARP